MRRMFKHRGLCEDCEADHHRRLSEERLHLGDAPRRRTGRLPGRRLLAVRQERDRDRRRRPDLGLPLLQIASSTERNWGSSLTNPKPGSIYILRDPRDIAISGANYFQFDRFPRLAALFRSMQQGEKLFRHTLYPLLVRPGLPAGAMTEALLQGSAAVHNWFRVSWRDHWRPYQQAGVPIVRYEDLLATPEEQAGRILRHLGIERTPEQIATAVQNQSFERKKETLLRAVKPAGRNFSASGKADSGARSCPRICSNDSSENSAKNWRSGDIPPKESTRRCPERQVCRASAPLATALPAGGSAAYAIHFGGDAPCSSNF